MEIKKGIDTFVTQCHGSIGFVLEVAVYCCGVILSVLVLQIFIPSSFNFVTQDDLILLVTAGILLLYTRETQKMREEMMKERSLSVQPGLVLRYNREGGGDWKFSLSNQGKGTALNPKISAVNVNGKVTFGLRGVVAIYPGDSITLDMDYGGDKNKQDILSNLSNQPFRLKIEFQNMLDSSKIFWTEVEILNPPECRITGFNWS